MAESWRNRLHGRVAGIWLHWGFYVIKVNALWSRKWFICLSLRSVQWRRYLANFWRVRIHWKSKFLFCFQTSRVRKCVFRVVYSRFPLGFLPAFLPENNRWWCGCDAGFYKQNFITVWLAVSMQACLSRPSHYRTTIATDTDWEITLVLMLQTVSIRYEMNQSTFQWPYVYVCMFVCLR